MQTPGRQVAPQTPMIPMERRMDLAYDRLLQRATEETQNLERPQTRVLGRVITQLESMNNTMRNIQEQIREDVRAKKRYYREEARLLREDNENLTDVKTNILSGLRGKGAAVLGGLGAAQVAGGNIGGAAQSFGLAGLLMAPEIIEFLTGSVVNVLALKGLIGGGKGAAASGVGSNIAGASKLKNPLLITAALAASLLIPSLANAGQRGDKRRLDLVRRELEGEQTINKPDVTRFRSLLDRFDIILSGITLDKEKQEGVVDQEKLKDAEFNKIDKDKSIKNNSENDTEDKDIAAPLNNLLSNNLNLVNNDKKTEKDQKALVETNIGETIFNEQINEGNVNVDTTSENNVNVEGDQIEIKQDKIEKDAEEISELLNPPENVNEINKQLNEKLDVTNVSKNIKPNNEVNNNLYNIGMTEDDSPKSISGFKGITATPDTVFVSTKFSSGGGLFDRFEAASSLRTYGAYS